MLLESKGDDNLEDWSADGRFFTYDYQLIYVRSFAPDGSGSGGKWRISTSGGLEPRWRRDGKELFCLSNTTLMAVEVKTEGGAFRAGIPKPLFETRLPPQRRNRYVVSRDGQRFLVNTPLEQTAAFPFHVLVNWSPGLEKVKLAIEKSKVLI